MASATLMNRFAKSVNKMGSGPFGSPIVAVVRVETIVEVISDMGYLTSLEPDSIDDMVSIPIPTIATLFWRLSLEREIQLTKRDVLGL